MICVEELDFGFAQDIISSVSCQGTPSFWMSYLGRRNAVHEARKR